MAAVKTRVGNRLGQIRKSRGVGASDLARRVHVSRQTIYAIEAGTYVPNNEVSLHLARELEVTVHDLFFASGRISGNARIAGGRSAQRGGSRERPARSNMSDGIALGECPCDRLP